MFPPFGLTWTPSGELGRAGGLTWTYTGIQRGDLFHIWWVVCDDPGMPCGLSLDGPIADWTPHPRGWSDWSYPPFIPPILVSMEGFIPKQAGKRTLFGSNA